MWDYSSSNMGLTAAVALIYQWQQQQQPWRYFSSSFLNQLIFLFFFFFSTMIDLWWLPDLTLLLLHKWQISWNHQESADCHLDLPGSVDSNWSRVFYRILAPICRNDQTNSHNTQSVVWWHLLLQTYIAATMAIFRSPPSLITKLLTFWKVIFCVTNWYRPKNVK